MKNESYWLFCLRMSAAFFVPRKMGDLLGRTNIKIVRFYDGSRTAKEVMSEAIACKVKKILSDDLLVYSMVL